MKSTITRHCALNTAIVISSRQGLTREVILALYQEKGPEFLDDLQGMFAFALYDSEKDTYLIGRDHLGSSHCIWAMTNTVSCMWPQK